MSKLVINTSDGKTFQVDPRLKDLSKFVGDWFADSSDPLSVALDSAVFQKVLEYCEIHDYKPVAVSKPLKSANLKDNLSEKDYKFVGGYDYLNIKPLLDAAFYLNFEGLREVGIAVVATEFYIGNTIEDIENLKKKFGVKDDLTLEEEQKLLNEYPWAADEHGEGKGDNKGALIEEESKA